MIPSLAARARATRATMKRDAKPAFEESDTTLVANLRLKQREAYRPGRCMWQIVDARDGMLFERQFEFDRASDARRSGLARLAQLTSSLPSVKIPGRIAGSAPLSRLVIVSHTQNR